MNKKKAEEIALSLNIIDDTHIDRTIRETGDVSDNGLQEIYVNTKIDDGSDIAELMRIYKEQDTYDYEKFPHTSERKRQFIVSEGGRKEMCELVENYAKEVAEEAAKKAARKAIKKNEKVMAKKLFAKDVDFDTVLHSVENITAEELKKIYEEVKRISA